MDEIQRIFSNARDYINTRKARQKRLHGPKFIGFSFSAIKWSNGYVSSIDACESSIEVRFKDIVNDEFFIQNVSYINY